STPTTPSGSQSLSTSAPLSLPDRQPKKQRRNGYEVTPQAPGYTPYSLSSRGRPTRAAFAVGEVLSIQPLKPLTEERWNELALEAGVLKAGSRLHPYQMESANFILGRSGDLVVIAPTGMGKSTVWDLPLLVQPGSISLVLVPFTTLGDQGEERHTNSSLPSVFISAEKKSEGILIGAAQGDFRLIFACPEMLETPAFARVLFSDVFRLRLSAVYIDEAHCVHEHNSWRPAYTRLHKLREIIREDVPIVALSATLPDRYRKSLVLYAGLKTEYRLINLGNFHPELSVVAMNMEHDSSSFLDLAFTLRLGTTSSSDIDETLIYSDDIDLLTDMYWWYYTRLASMSLPASLLDILHAGLSKDHQLKSVEDFKAGRTKILLGTDKIGAGVDFPKVRWVIQYRCRGITLVQWEQRRGRGGRRQGDISTGILMVEKSMAAGGDLTVDKPGFEDPALLDLIYSTTLPFPLSCCDIVIDKWLENPPRVSPSPLRPNGCCGNCLPTLLPGKERQFIAYNPLSSSSSALPVPRLLDSEKKKIFVALVEWRDTIWRTDGWKEKWPCYGPQDILPNLDLDEVAKHARTILSGDELVRKLHTIHALALGLPLFCEVKRILADICIETTPPLQLEVD
ncbi:P-loop containing nucleoside triphosphate hydrolase protein, partial [Flammula alnicola]